MKPQPKPLQLAIGRSRRLAWIVLSGQALSLCGVLLFPPPPPVTALLLLMWVFIGLHAWWSHLCPATPSRVVHLLLDGQGGWQLTQADGRVIEPRLCPDSRVTPALILLNFRVGRWRRRSLLLLSDSADAGALRRLRVRLRAGGGYAGGAASTAESGS